VGIFLFFRDPQDEQHLFPLTEFLPFAKRDGVYLTAGKNYEILWGMLESVIRGGGLSFLEGSDPQQWPRGRVVFHTGLNRFEVYLDERLRLPGFEREILKSFRLPKGQTVFLSEPGHNKK